MTERRSQRFKVVFTPVGWQVVDTREARDPVAEFGTGSSEYARATEEAKRLNGPFEVQAARNLLDSDYFA